MMIGVSFINNDDTTVYYGWHVVSESENNKYSKAVLM